MNEPEKSCLPRLEIRDHKLAWVESEIAQARTVMTWFNRQADEIVCLRAELATYRAQQCATCRYTPSCKMKHKPDSPLPDRGCYCHAAKAEVQP